MKRFDVTNQTHPVVLIQDVLEYFCAGRLAGVLDAKIGSSANTYLVSNQNNEHFYVRIFRVFNSEKFAFEVDAQSKMRAAGILTNYLHVSREGQMIYESNGIKAYISKRLVGSHPSYPASFNQGVAVGELLAKLHTNIQAKKYNNQSIISSKKIYDRVKSTDLLAMNGEVVYNILNSWEEVSNNRELPNGFVHGDLHGGNVIINDNNAIAIDLDNSGKGKFILDLGRCIADVSRLQGRIDFRSVLAVITGYQNKRQLQVSELECLQCAIAYGALCVALWAYEKGRISLFKDFWSICLQVSGQDASFVMRNLLKLDIYDDTFHSIKRRDQRRD